MAKVWCGWLAEGVQAEACDSPMWLCRPSSVWQEHGHPLLRSRLFSCPIQSVPITMHTFQRVASGVEAWCTDEFNQLLLKFKDVQLHDADDVRFGGGGLELFIQRWPPTREQDVSDCWISGEGSKMLRVGIFSSVPVRLECGQKSTRPPAMLLCLVTAGIPPRKDSLSGLGFTYPTPPAQDTPFRWHPFVNASSAFFEKSAVGTPCVNATFLERRKLACLGQDSSKRGGRGARLKESLK